MEQQPAQFTVYDDAITRKAVEKITAVSADTILISVLDTEDKIRVTLK